MRLNKLRKGIRAKLRSVSGLSFAELLVTTLILLLVTEIVADGLPAVIRLYRQTVDIANAEAYLSTTIIALRSKLCLASLSDDEDIYIDPVLGRFKILNNADKGIQIQDGVDMASPPPPRTLLPGVRNDTSELITSYKTITPVKEGDEVSFVITGLSVKKRGSSEEEKPLAGIGEG